MGIAETSMPTLSHLFLGKGSADLGLCGCCKNIRILIFYPSGMFYVLIVFHLTEQPAGLESNHANRRRLLQRARVSANPVGPLYCLFSDSGRRVSERQRGRDRDGDRADRDAL